MKYVMFHSEHCALWPVVFPDHVAHSAVKVEGMHPIGAGFVNPQTGECFGKSDSLKLESHADDALWVGLLLTNRTAEMLLLNAERIANAEDYEQRGSTGQN